MIRFERESCFSNFLFLRNLDPEVRVIPLGSQDSIWGRPTCLHGQIGLFAVLQESLNLQNVRIFHEAGMFHIVSIYNRSGSLSIFPLLIFYFFRSK